MARILCNNVDSLSTVVSIVRPLYVCNHLAKEERAGCFTLIIFLMSCSVSFPDGAMGCSALRHCGISCLYQQTDESYTCVIIFTEYCKVWYCIGCSGWGPTIPFYSPCGIVNMLFAFV